MCCVAMCRWEIAGGGKAIMKRCGNVLMDGCGMVVRMHFSRWLHKFRETLLKLDGGISVQITLGGNSIRRMGASGMETLRKGQQQIRKYKKMVRALDRDIEVHVYALRSDFR